MHFMLISLVFHMNAHVSAHSLDVVINDMLNALSVYCQRWWCVVPALRLRTEANKFK